MKYLLFLLIVLASCSHRKKETRCTFGLDTTYYKEQNATSAEKRKKDPPPVYPSGVVVAPSGYPVILLDFDGCTVSGTNWNWNGDIVCGGSGLDSISMQIVIDKVKATFFPWNVLVTTIDTLYDKAPINKRTRVILTTDSDWYGLAGGASFVNGFTTSTPCFVFTKLLGFNIKYIQEATCHEIGHNLGLYHQSTWENGVKINEYSFGGNGTAPIMGNSYYQPISIWITGTNSNGDPQNDSAIISTKLVKK